MKSICLSFFISCLLFGTSLSAQTKPQRCVSLDVTVVGQTVGSLVNLVGVYGDQNYRADTAIVLAGGLCSFKRDTGYLPGFYYVLFSDNTSIQILLDKDPNVVLKTEKADMIGKMQVSNSLDNDLLYRNLKFQTQIEPRAKSITERLQAAQPGTPAYVAARADFDQLQTERAAHLEAFRRDYPTALFTKFKLAGQNPTLIEPKKADGSLDTAAQVYAYRMAFWNDVDFTDVRLLHTPVYFNKLKRFIGELSPQHQDSLIPIADYIIVRSLANKELFKFTANYIATQYRPGKTNLMDGEKVYSHIIEKYWTSELAFWSNEKEINSLRQQAKQMKGSFLGLTGQDVRAKDFNGEYKSIYDLKSKFIVVYIYNPNCEHCQEETPKLWAYYQKAHPQGLLDVYSIVTTTTREEWGAYRTKVGFNWPDVYDTDPYESKWPLKYHVDITPEIYLLDPDRKIIAKNINVTQLEEVIERERKARGI